MIDLVGKKILIVEGSLLSAQELSLMLKEAGARVYTTSNAISAFNLIERVGFDGAMIDYALHNEAFELCEELRSINTPYICCNAPHRLQGTEAHSSDARAAVERLSRVMSERAQPSMDASILANFVKGRTGKGGGFGEPPHGF